MATKKDPFTAQLEKALNSRGLGVNTEQDEIRTKALAALDELGKLSVKDDSVKFDGDNLVLPQRFSGNLLEAAAFIEQIHESEEQEYEFDRTFKYRPWDGAAAFQRALYRVFGTVGIGKTTQTFFGPQPPKLISISVGVNKNLQVPWGEVTMAPLDATFYLGGHKDPEYGSLFNLSVNAPKKQRRRLEAFFDVVQDELENRSIYKGQAFNGAEQPEFLDLSSLDESKIIYSDEVMSQLSANLWSVIQHTDTMRSLGIPLKRAVLLEGPFGTGKSEAGRITAKRAQENGWTFILARPGKDDVFEVLNTAKLYAPAVVQFEDIDVIASEGSSAKISRLLDALDGISNKSTGVLALFTTNYVDRIQKGVMRPGRIDAVVHIADLDRNGVEKLIRSVVDPRVLSDDVDYDTVFAEMHGFLPAFVKEAVDRAVRYAVSRNDGKTNFTIVTEDIVNAAIGLRHQLALMNDAKEGTDKPTVDSTLREAVTEQVTDVILRSQMADNYDFSVKDPETGKYVKAPTA
jgi:hypothetical protein